MIATCVPESEIVAVVCCGPPTQPEYWRKCRAGNVRLTARTGPGSRESGEEELPGREPHLSAIGRETARSQPDRSDPQRVRSDPDHRLRRARRVPSGAAERGIRSGGRHHRVANRDLADSALHAPAAGFGDSEFYPEFIDKAAVLTARLAKNHPLRDGNKRAARVALRLFIEINGWRWDPMPSVDDAERSVLAIAAGDGAAAEHGALAVLHRDGHFDRLVEVLTSQLT